jgi:hypothetical protein
MPDPMRTLRIAAVIAVTAAAALSAAGSASASASAAGVPYGGTTKEGTKIAFDLKDGWVDHIQSRVPTSCVSAQGGTPRVTIDLWDPPFKFRLGRKGTVKVTEPYPTRHFTFTSRRVGRTIRGTLALSYSRLVNSAWGGDYLILTCSGTASFTVRPRG